MGLPGDEPPGDDDAEAALVAAKKVVPVRIPAAAAAADDPAAPVAAPAPRLADPAGVDEASAACGAVVRSSELSRRLATPTRRALDVDLYVDGLVWRSDDRKRQGELLNNDQRRANVSGFMSASSQLSGIRGDVLLLDDYTGSGSTLKEATRALQKGAGIKSKVVPLCVARVRWKLGQAGMV